MEAMEEGRERPHFAYPSGWVVRHALDGSLVIGSRRLWGMEDSLSLSLSLDRRGGQAAVGRPAGSAVAAARNCVASK